MAELAFRPAPRWQSLQARSDAPVMRMLFPASHQYMTGQDRTGPDRDAEAGDVGTGMRYKSSSPGTSGTSNSSSIVSPSFPMR